MRCTGAMPKRGFITRLAVVLGRELGGMNVFSGRRDGDSRLLRAHDLCAAPLTRSRLRDGELTTKLAIHAQAFSASAKEKITKAGGTFEVVA